MWPFKSKKEPKSTHRVEVIRIKEIIKHPNADTLGIIKVYGYQCVVKLGDYSVGDLVAYIQPDSVVPDSEQFAFLGKAVKNDEGFIIGHETLRRQDRRITAKKFRGERSEGLLMEAPRRAKEGDNVAERMGVTRYVSQKELREQELDDLKVGFWGRINRRGRKGLAFAGNERGPSIWIPVYDLENWYRYPDMFREGEPVYFTEKIHGCNARFVYSEVDKRFYAGSRQTWKRPFTVIPYKGLIQNILVRLGLRDEQRKPAQDDWNRVARLYPQIEEFCRANPDHVLFAEIYGDGVQDLTYGLTNGQIDVSAFDVFYKGTYWDYVDALKVLSDYRIPTVPLLASGPYSEELVRSVMDGSTSVMKDKPHMREGCVIRPEVETTNEERGMPGRKVLKAVSSAYLERASKEECDRMNEARKFKPLEV